jgi:hypothetical protein
MASRVNLKRGYVMRRILFAIIFSTLLFSAVIPYQNVYSQTKKSKKQKKSQEKKKTPDFSKIWENYGNVPLDGEIDDSDQYSYKWLCLDMRMVDVVAYINVKEVKYSGRDSESTDCENNKGGGYCFYNLIAEVKEIYKGKIENKSIELSASADATYSPKYFLGEQVVFLDWSEGEDKKKYLVTNLENSSREIKHNVLEKLRNILNPNSLIDDTDEKNPYSLKYISKNFQEADVVIYTDVLSLEPDKYCEGFCSEPFILKAKIKEVFKGKLNIEQTFEYRDDLLHRPMREEDLGEQILYLKKKVENGKIYYEKVEYTEGWIQHNILEKLRKIAKEKSNNNN